ncbi:uncharacterized protein LOC117111326 isoform X3 [Anneissia japonica]|uniref:uncharacterized protein LOC117111326 isoform X3 n=1 Tax=Anneissia japonica TaxID=1529436 RepID=UPI0014259263|nr:uncharacterized protein LOC117111326 isoform X3 [Anneissia japonica]
MKDSENVDQAQVNDSIQPPDTVVRRLIKNLLFPTLKALLYHHQMVRRLIKNRLFQTLIPFLDLLQVLNKKTNPTDHFCFVEFFKVDSAGTC